ncbi:hypothetical protein D3C87_923150 [compost metagenome]
MIYAGAFLLSFLLLFLIAALSGLAILRDLSRRERTRMLSRLAMHSATLSTAVIASALLLSGCGTAPSRARTFPPVPADLLTPPSKPVLLTPVSPSTTPGTTTTSTRNPAPPIASGIAR